jgi:hypothetical protein
MVTIRTLRRVSSVLPLTRRLADAAAVVIFIALSVRLVRVNDTVHAVIALAVTHIFIDAEA